MAELLESTTEPPDFDLVEAKVDEIGEAFSVLYDSKSWVKHVPPAYVPILSALLSRSFVIGESECRRPLNRLRLMGRGLIGFWGTKAVDRTEAILKGAGQLTDWHIDNSAHIHLNEVGKIEATRLSSKEMVKRALSKIRDGFYAKEIWSMGGLAKARLNEDGRTYSEPGTRCMFSYLISCADPLGCSLSRFNQMLRRLVHHLLPKPDRNRRNRNNPDRARMSWRGLHPQCPWANRCFRSRPTCMERNTVCQIGDCILAKLIDVGYSLHDFVEHLDGRRSRKRCKCFKGHPDSYADAYPHDHVDE